MACEHCDIDAWAKAWAESVAALPKHERDRVLADLATEVERSNALARMICDDKPPSVSGGPITIPLEYC